MDQVKEDLKYLEIAELESKSSYAKRRQVGAVIVKNRQIISEGYNGTPSGFDNECEELLDGNLVTKSIVLHAESNAITKLAKSTQSSDGATMYCTCSPCIECAKLIIQSGIKRLVYKEVYHSTEGIDLLKKVGVEVISYDELINSSNDEVMKDIKSSLDNFIPKDHWYKIVTKLDKIIVLTDYLPTEVFFKDDKNVKVQVIKLW